jgi:hypothetical protein
LAARKENGAVSREDLINVLQLGLIVAAVLVGREVGNLYSSFGEVSNLKIMLNVEEETLSDYLRGTLAGSGGDLRLGLAITLPGLNGSLQAPVTQMPDYVRRWLITVTLSPVTVLQPEVSDVEVQLQVEGETIQRWTYTFPREKISYLKFLNRDVALRADSTEELRDLILEAAGVHGGEVEVTMTGRVRTHLLWFETWLPFTTTRYPLVTVPHLRYVSSQWRDLNGAPANSVNSGESGYVYVRLDNPTRIHSIRENVTCTFYKEGQLEPMLTVTKEVGVAAGTEATYTFPFTFDEPGTYRYTLSVEDGLSLDEDSSPRLSVET